MSIQKVSRREAVKAAAAVGASLVLPHGAAAAEATEWPAHQAVQQPTRWALPVPPNTMVRVTSADVTVRTTGTVNGMFMSLIAKPGFCDILSAYPGLNGLAQKPPLIASHVSVMPAIPVATTMIFTPFTIVSDSMPAPSQFVRTDIWEKDQSNNVTSWLLCITQPNSTVHTYDWLVTVQFG